MNRDAQCHPHLLKGRLKCPPSSFNLHCWLPYLTRIAKDEPCRLSRHPSLLPSSQTNGSISHSRYLFHCAQYNSLCIGIWRYATCDMRDSQPKIVYKQGLLQRSHWGNLTERFQHSGPRNISMSYNGNTSLLEAGSVQAPFHLCLFILTKKNRSKWILEE